MKWKDNARKRPMSLAAFQKSIGEATTGLSDGLIGHVNGKPHVTRTHQRDFVEYDESGNGLVTASLEFREGQYLFPFAYYHPRKKIVGKVVDAKWKGDRGWAIKLDAVLRDNEGEPVRIDGQMIDQTGWFLESHLVDAGLGMVALKPGATAPSTTEIIERRNARVRRLTDMHAALPAA